MTTTERTGTPHARPPLWRNTTFLKWAAQLAFLALFILFFWALYRTGVRNQTARNLDFDWDFLTDPPGITIAEGFDTTPETGAEALAVGIVNMLRITASGIVAATILGVFLGIFRLSANWLLSKVATVYVETLRNIPLLVQIFFWSAVATLSFPVLAPDNPVGIPGWILLSKKGISIAWFFPRDGFWQWLAFVIAGALTARWLYRKRIEEQEETGRETHAARWALLTFLAFAVAGWWLHPVAGALGWIFGALGAFFRWLPTVALQAVLAATSVVVAARWIVSFRRARTSPAGTAHFTDDDYFRMALAGVMGIGAAALFMAQPAIADILRRVLAFVFEFLDSKYDWMRPGPPLEFSRPEIVLPGRFPQYAPTGMTMTPAFFAVWVGVTLYTAAFIAEIVRGGILAVPKGQTEAGLAIGLTRAQLLRFIILPQAFRIILPPMGNQYLNLAKNTSLAIAVGYPDIVQVGQTIFNQTGASLQVFLIWVAFYLSVSLSISAVVNWYNRRVKLVER